MRGLLITLVFVIPAVKAQSLSGIVTAADTGATLPNVTVIAVQRPALPGTKPVFFQSTTDAIGHYTMSLVPGKYELCVHPRPQSFYLNPCQWGTSIVANVFPAAVSTVSIKLQKGARLVVRVHDTNQVLPQAESVPGTAISAFVTSASVSKFPLPQVYSDRIIRDYEAVVPIGVPLSVTISSTTVLLADQDGTPFSALPISFQVTDEAIGLAAPALVFTSAVAKMVHVYTVGAK